MSGKGRRLHGHGYVLRTNLVLTALVIEVYEKLPIPARLPSDVVPETEPMCLHLLDKRLYH